MSTPSQEDFLRFCKGLTNANRQNILFAVFSDKEEHTVSEVSQRTKLAKSTTSEHLTMMKNAGILLSQKREREVYYRVDKRKIREYLALIENWLTCC